MENKLENPADFLDNFGVLPTTMMLCTIFMYVPLALYSPIPFLREAYRLAIGFYGYNGFGERVQPTITTNVPANGLYSSINIFLMVGNVDR